VQQLLNRSKIHDVYVPANRAGEFNIIFCKINNKRPIVIIVGSDFFLAFGAYADDFYHQNESSSSMSIWFKCPQRGQRNIIVLAWKLISISISLSSSVLKEA
jgi:hypothetical protein